MTETHEYKLQRCEKCGIAVGTKRHLAWLCERLGPLGYTNSSLLLAQTLLGIGNTLKGGDAAGPLMCERLSGRVPARVIDAGTVPENYIGPFWQQHRRCCWL